MGRAEARQFTSDSHVLLSMHECTMVRDRETLRLTCADSHSERNPMRITHNNIKYPNAKLTPYCVYRYRNRTGFTLYTVHMRRGGGCRRVGPGPFLKP